MENGIKVGYWAAVIGPWIVNQWDREVSPIQARAEAPRQLAKRAYACCECGDLPEFAETGYCLNCIENLQA